MDQNTGKGADESSWPKGIGAITLFVDDLETAKQFYRKVFGLPVAFENDDSAMFKFGNTLINLLKTTVEWIFAALDDSTTFVSITHAGFTGDGDELVKRATDSTQGFTLVLAGLKALLEHNIRLNLVADRYPNGIENH